MPSFLPRHLPADRRGFGTRIALSASATIAALALVWSGCGAFTSPGSAEPPGGPATASGASVPPPGRAANQPASPPLPLLEPALLPGGRGTSSGTSSAPTGGGSLPSGGPPSAPGASRPNIVFVLTDDLSLNLLRFMPHVLQMERFGLTFTNYFVSDSLCCPSRSSIFTGNFPHDTHVFNNVGASGGFNVFYSRGEQRHTFAVALRRKGYLTAMMGKYLNGYMDQRGGVPGLPLTYVPPGWSEWDVVGNGYGGFNYTMNENGRLVRHGGLSSDYLTDVIAAKGESFVTSAAAAHRPFFLELATFSPHAPYVPAPADIGGFYNLKLPREPNFNVLPSDPPLWLANHRPLTPAQIALNDHIYSLRAEDVQSVDRMIANVELALINAGVAGNTYFFFSSDNGLHTGQYRLMSGKMTAFDTDIHVPLVVIGPRIPYGIRAPQMTENVDLAATFAELGGTTVHSDGHSLVQLLSGSVPKGWRNAILVEHHGPDLRGVDPDFQQPASGSPRTYEALRTPSLLYVEYDDGERELYDLRADPFELHNLAAHAGARELRLLHRGLLRMERCHNHRACWAAMHLRS